MAGNLKPSELRSVLRRLDSANRALETGIQSLEECQKTLQKSIQCQNYLNHRCVKSACHESSAIIIEGGRCASFDHLEEIKISQLYKLQVICQSIQPIKAGFVPNENARAVPGHAAI